VPLKMSLACWPVVVAEVVLELVLESAPEIWPLKPASLSLKLAAPRIRRSDRPFLAEHGPRRLGFTFARSAHHRAVWEPSTRAQHSSRWLGRRGVALLFAYASFGRLDLGVSAARLSTSFPWLFRPTGSHAEHFVRGHPFLRSSGTADT
jgi:hypothetical protein